MRDETRSFKPKVCLFSCLFAFFFVIRRFSEAVVSERGVRTRRRSVSKEHVTHLRHRGSDVIKQTCVVATEVRLHAGEMTRCADYTEAADKGSMFYLLC